MKKPLVSFIVPVYNCYNFIESCILSIIRQTYKNIEIICVDDGSTDNSYEKINSLIKKDHRIKLYRQNNQGAGKARNFGLKESHGKYIAFVDSDDFIIDLNIVNEIIYIMEYRKINICGGNILRFSDNKLMLHPDKRMYFNTCGKIYYETYQFDYGYWRFIYNKEFLKDHRVIFPNYRRFQDPPFFVRAMIYSKYFFFINKNFYAWRQNYKRITLNSKNISDIISGLTDNLLLSKYYNLGKLHNLCISRINYLCDELKPFLDNKGIYSKLLFFNDEISKKLLISNGFSIKNDYRIKILL